MDAKVLPLLEKVDKKFDRFDDKFSQQNDRINSLEKMLKHISASKTSEDDRENVRSRHCRNENFINQTKAELEDADYKKRELKGTKTKIKKAASFHEKPTRIPTRIRRSIHTVPSDKDEERRLNSFRRECLSKAIQWNVVDLVKAASEGQSIILPKWLCREEIKTIKIGSDRKNHLRRFLCILIEKDFVTMQEWLQSCKLDEKVVKRVWETFEEFSDVETNKSRMKCFHCRLVETVNVLDVVDYLFSAEIISSELCQKISSSELIVGAQEGLWKEVLEECRRYIHPKALVTTFKISMTDKLSLLNDKEKFEYESLLSMTVETDAADLFTCRCQERCSKSFHPVSCLKSMSLAGVYFSQPPQRKRENSSSSSENPQSSLSSGTSCETVAEESKNRADILSSPDEETELKKPVVPPRIPKGNQGQGGKSEIVKFQDRPHSDNSRTLRRKSKQKEEICHSESSSDYFDGDQKPVVPVRNSVKSVTNMSSHRLENKPNVIRAQNVIFNTGPKYILTKERANYSYSSDSSKD
ncbi:uncharacterized protein LOC128554604 [Mercenaria mercenaria]|uniref:uncharacterized protein LOC128554604 n=1 Tax=Mercenaria mercenaria TaxID=6596 RepID=UPI00234EA03A|nr:uncharacterized protein LOC128554604 [Mercenaria mercenaria]